MGFWDRVKDAVIGEATDRQPASSSPGGDLGRADRSEDTIDTPRAGAAQKTSHKSYTVRSGDTLSEIGERFGVEQSDIAELNDLENPELIYPGQVLKIPEE